jgi:hypothetical protein
LDRSVGGEQLDGYRLAQKAKDLDGTMIVEPMPIPGVGSSAMFQDPSGDRHGRHPEDSKKTGLSALTPPFRIREPSLTGGGARCAMAVECWS